MLISVIIPVYNSEKFLNRCVDSVLKQSYKELDIILIDDGSSDKSGEMCDQYAQMDKRVRVIHQKNRGVSAARNSGLDVAIGDYCTFVDSDDYIESEMYQSMIDIAEQYNCDVIMCDCVKEFGTRTEMKNLNSFSAIARAIEGEMERQIDLIEDGKKVVQETRRWDDDKEYSYPMRSKEDAQDYRYFPEPDLTPIVISDEWLDEIRSRQPEFRDEKQARYKEQFGLPEYDINIITEDKTLTDLFESCIELGAAAKEVSNWIMGDIMRLLKEKEMEASDIHFSPANLVKMIQMIESGAINRKVAKKVFEAIFDEDVDPEVYVEENGLKTVNDEGALRKVIEEIVANNPKSVEDYKAGKKKAMGFFVGQTMRAMKGKADPAMVNQILKEMLD